MPSHAEFAVIYINDYVNQKYYLRYLLFRIVPEFLRKIVIGYKYKRTYNRKINWNNPKHLSEKIQYLKLYEKDGRKTVLADKILVKEYIKDKIPELKCAKIYKQAKSFNELNINDLPEKFMLKTNHSWKTLILIENKNELTYKELRDINKYYNKMLKINYAYYSYYEMHYKDIKPYVFAEEEFIGCKKERNNYEIWCFHGEPEFVLRKTHHIDSGYKQCFYNPDWEQAPFYMDNYKHNDPMELPKNKDKIIEYAKILSKDFNFVRVDFMEADNELYFGEMTFTPNSGFFKFVPEEFDLIYGRKLILNKNKNI